MHVLILPSENYQTAHEPLGAIFQKHQADALRRKGFQIGVVSAGLIPLRFSFSSYPFPAYENDNGIHIYRLFRRQILPERVAMQLGLELNKTIQQKMRLRLFMQYIKQHGAPDVIHAHDCLLAGSIAAEIKSKWDVPYVVTEHSSAHAMRRIPDWLKPTVMKALIQADIRTGVSTSLCRLLTNVYGLDTGHPVVNIGNILDKRFEATFDKLDSKALSTRDRFTFLNVASLDQAKGHLDLCSAFATYFAHRAGVYLRIAGDGPLRSTLVRHVKELGIEKQVSFLGRLDRESVVAEMKNCNAFVLSSHFETFGVVLIEALACGKPVVSTACGGPEDIVSDLNGILVPPNEPSALAEGMKRIFKEIENYDPVAIHRDCIERFGEEAFVDRLSLLYQQATIS